jgi:hypothetical protein
MTHKARIRLLTGTVLTQLLLMPNLGWPQLATGVPGASTLITEDVKPSRRADFLLEQVSQQARDLGDWVVRTGDHQGAPFVLVDKIDARAYVFNSKGRLQGAAPVLLGLTLGDEGVKGIGNRPLSRILPQERTTPSGRFEAALAQNLSGQLILWVDYEQGISLHPLRSVDAKERRLERLLSSTPTDNRISYGCINVPVEFWRDVVLPLFRGTVGLVYVMPEASPLGTVFPMATPSP